MESNSKSDRDFDDVALKDSLDAIHKAVAARIALVGLFLAGFGTLVGAAFQQRAWIFLVPSVVVLVALCVIDKVQRNALCSYYYRFIELAHRAYGRGRDYVWLAGFTPVALLQEFESIAASDLPTEERAARLQQALGSLKAPSFLIATTLGALVWIVCCVLLALYSDWTVLPVNSK